VNGAAKESLDATPPREAEEGGTTSTWARTCGHRLLLEGRGPPHKKKGAWALCRGPEMARQRFGEAGTLTCERLRRLSS